MKRILSALLFFAASIASAATLAPIQMLSTAGSTSGQAIVSTGPSTPAAWSNVTASGLVAQAANTVVANVAASSASPTAVAIPSCSTSTSALQYTSGTGFSCGTGFAALTGATFTGPTGVSYSNSAFTLNDSSGSAKAQVIFSNAGAIAWTWDNVSASANKFALDRYVSGSYVDSPLSVSNSTGAVTMSDGITSTPISGSTGSFTTLSASGSITPSPTAGIAGVTSSSVANAGSVGEHNCLGGSGIALTSGAANVANVANVSLAAGEYSVSASMAFNPAAATVMSAISASTSTTSATQGAPQTALNMTFPTGLGQSIAVATPVFYKFTTATTLYLVASSTFSGGTNTATGTLCWLRIR